MGKLWAALLVGPFVAFSCANGIDDAQQSASDGGGAQGGSAGVLDGGWAGNKDGAAGKDGTAGASGGADAGSDTPSCFPSPEICDGIDNDCNGTIDDGDPAKLCPVTNGTGKCDGTSGCAIGSCATDYYDLDGKADTGCECQAAPAPVTTGSTCATAIDVGPLSDVAATTVTQKGNIPVAGRELWYAFKATDDADTAGDEFHVDVRFLTNPSDGYKMDVYRGGCPGADAGEEKIADGETADTDWFVDFDKGSAAVTCASGTGCGEGNCKPKATSSASWNICADDSAEFRVRIYTAGAPTCATYDLELSNGKY